MSRFNGFSEKTIEFFAQLTVNNDKGWFDKHKEDYISAVLEPSQSFISEMIPKIKTISETLNGIPKSGKSISRANRDIRFSKDKSPYKAGVDLWFWEGEQKTYENSGFIVCISASGIMFGAGILEFTKPLLEKYRNAVSKNQVSDELTRIIGGLQKAGIPVDGKTYKKMPKGYEPEDNESDLLLYSGMSAGISESASDIFCSHEFIDYSLEKFKELAPLHLWLSELVCD